MTDNTNTPPGGASTTGSDQDALSRIAQSIESTADLLAGVIEQQEQRIRNENTWSTVKRTAALTAIIGFAIAYITLYAPMAWKSRGPAEKSVAVLNIQGRIGGVNTSNADTIAPAIIRACANPNTAGLVLRINSPGGSPSEAERIASAIGGCRENGKRVVAVIEGMGASAGYMLALEADTIWANRYGMVGSIGAVMRSIDGSELAGRLGLRERVYASGGQKSGGGILSPDTEEQKQAARDLVNAAGEMFRDDVRARRGDRLKETEDMWSGRTWLAREAKAVGLIDRVGVFEVAYREEFGDLPKYSVSTRPTFRGRMNLEEVTKRLASAVVTELTAERLE